MIGGGKRAKTSVVLTCLLVSVSALSTFGDAGHIVLVAKDQDHGFWQPLIGQAKAERLPTQFLVAIDPNFVTLEFDDLHAFAAEYHPEGHRLVLNQSLSFNGAGGALKPLARLTPREVGTLFHELFHAYMDYISLADPIHLDPTSAGLLGFARDRQQCWYQQVSITPIMQRRSRTEVRFLSERESWEALNETWGVFVGWAVWTTLEGQRRAGSRVVNQDFWVTRLKKADQDGDLIGYYEPETAAERSIARKRYLAPSHRITPEEARQLLGGILELPQELVDRSVRGMQQGRLPLPGGVPCHESANSR